MNERVSAEVARFLDLPILPHDVVEWGGHLLFGSQFMPSGTWSPNTTRVLFGGCINRDCVYELIVLDAWLCNTDRHSQNLLVRHSRGPGASDLLLLNDHSHALVLPGKTPADLHSLVSAPVSTFSTHLDFVREAITDPARLGEALAKVEGVSDLLIAGILDGVPGSWLLAKGDRAAYRDFLIARRSVLRSLFDAERAIFANLSPGGAAP